MDIIYNKDKLTKLIVDIDFNEIVNKLIVEWDKFMDLKIKIQHFFRSSFT